ncbi:hypothetical protein M422DRAFT_48470 [Sphaerobolus stellatus SS14]|uniref:Heterokaryon incompatibility domain-containing protein n=1 Tax=Sphaerobolus stellatus (strain SS14) TaxID=990650 RepID=A0A0C9VUU9_SPHS4|nr:hypothetical protein M422DRAFT_48470 [Sphaerobolus stellatus SS14]
MYGLTVLRTLDNSLPRCQLERLQDYIIKAVGKRFIAFWIDTLCIPVAYHLKEYRKLAITMLGETFSKSTATLVLDRELCSIQATRVSNLELCIRIMCGSWMKRLWTLQEAVFTLEKITDNSRLCFQTSDCAVKWDLTLAKFVCLVPGLHQNLEFWSKHDGSIGIPDRKSEITGDTAEVFMGTRIPSLKYLKRASFGGPFFKLATAVQNRLTSKQEDEPICSHLYFNFPSQIFLKIRPFLNAIIFCSEQKPDRPANLQKYPFRWAPESLLSLDTHSSYLSYYSEAEDTRLGICEVGGLHIQNKGFILRVEGLTLLSETAIVDIRTNKRYYLTWLEEASGEGIALLFHSYQLKSSIHWQAAIVRIEERWPHEDGTESYVTFIGHGNLNEVQRHSGYFDARDCD